MNEGPITDEQAERSPTLLDVSMSDVIDMDRRLGSPDVSLNAPRSREEGDSPSSSKRWSTRRRAREALTAAGEERAFRQDLLARALETLPERERDILIERQLRDEPKTLEELGAVYGISRERSASWRCARSIDSRRRSRSSLSRPKRRCRRDRQALGHVAV